MIQIGTLVRRREGHKYWHSKGSYMKGYFTDVGEVIGFDRSGRTFKVRWPEGEWFRYDVPDAFIIEQKLDKWKLSDELFEI